MAYWMFAIDNQGEPIVHKGDSGPMSIAYPVEGDKLGTPNYNAEPKIGCCMQVGSPYGRTFSGQDWWMTTPVTEIVSREVAEDKTITVVFKTKNSTYKWSN